MCYFPAQTYNYNLKGQIDLVTVVFLCTGCQIFVEKSADRCYSIGDYERLVKLRQITNVIKPTRVQN